MGPGHRLADMNLTGLAKAELCIFKRLVNHRLKHIACVRAHHRDHRLIHGHIDGHALGMFRDMALQPAHLAPDGGGRCNHQIFICRQAGDRHICFDTAGFIQPLGIHNAARVDRHIICTDQLQDLFGIPADDLDLAECGEVKQAGRLAHSLMFSSGIVKPVLAAPAIVIFCCFALVSLALGQEPVGPLPAIQLTKAGAIFGQLVMQRCAAQTPGRGKLPVRIMVSIQKTKCFGHPGRQIMTVCLERVHPPDIHIPDIHLRAACIHPVGQRHTGTARRLNADRIKAGCDKEIAQLRGFPQQIAIIRGEAFRPVEKSLNAGCLQHGQTRGCGFQDRHEMIEIIRQGGEFKII